ncbi:MULTISPECIES: sigma-70 family RNA polymerase sigma factor [Mycobacteriaceae]|uniref:RNA polymerase sigma factor n=1 Tax=Mycolicibacterium llatzerense TaxID=280871 RepID=A0A0D1K0K9_9MYCO|nr:sigma-70 family RNA polymerase sigma factor [Mycolicibacterium llatzerense]KIU18449.1 RNA polymerase sigma factor SigL [Mycolicibacterium llatzerense]MCT7363651.1 RNA polymerase subunit sigma [Mycolicibacterium llatzerense]MCT7367807.1 RNA polymerase subunit sigma [Mycolicibacterium llatzerense]
MSDPEAAMMRVLYDEHAGALWRYALRLTQDSARAEDVVQETLLRAWRHPDVVSDTDQSPRAWLYTVARNLIIDEQRSARRRHETTSSEVVEAEDRTDPKATDEVDITLDRMLLGGALSQLSVDHRAVIERAYYRQLSVAQIAAELQIAEGTVKSRLHYAVRALRLNLQEMGVTR